MKVGRLKSEIFDDWNSLVTNKILKIMVLEKLSSLIKRIIGL